MTKNYDYDAFGNEINSDPNDTNPFRYCGEYWDRILKYNDWEFFHSVSAVAYTQTSGFQ